MSFSNLYYKRTAGTAKACYVCYKPTTTVLATLNTIDFLYTCPGHLADREFASSLGGVDGAGGGRKMGLTDEEIAKVKDEWEEKQRKKKENEKKEKEKEKEKETKGEKDKDRNDSDGSKEKESNSKSSKMLSTPKTPSSPVQHERFALHRDIFAMRQDVHRKRRQAAQAKNLAPRLPGAPSGTLAEDKY